MSASIPTTLDPAALQSFHTHLLKSRRILALLGAGLSAPSGLPTFRGPGGLWRTHSGPSLATPQAFAANPALVWQFYSHRRHLALSVQPNPAHYALAALATRVPAFQALSQNVDGLSQRAGHPPGQLQLLHGTLFAVHCSDEATCGYSAPDFTDPIVPALAIPTASQTPGGKPLDISHPDTPLPTPAHHDLPICPKCETHLLRPSVVWFGEALPSAVLDTVETYLDDPAGVDLMLVIGTSAQVFPAAGYIAQAEARGAKICVVDLEAGGGGPGDWVFTGDAAVVVPKLLEPLIGAVAAGG
ncbi:hypothetical protein B0A50_05023 [Salinomyces thailandicus]|uniref:Deacetylase sirtuin-type domain-containing protein n=1 Tax=Salinomyces thailandicus TaxID=706561 RepID=A0A4U0TY24_9PEZI|nr:hypothetical protein B0A50_05023 [Salinomyces thailandica]